MNEHDEKDAFLVRLDALRPFDDDGHRNRLTCALIGHSRIQTVCMGYYNCARCGDQLGDTLCGTYPGAETAVIVGHRCEVCEENAKTLTWKDTLFAPDPFEDDAHDDDSA